MKRLTILLVIVLAMFSVAALDPIQVEEICNYRAYQFAVECYWMTYDVQMCSEISAQIYADCVAHGGH